MLQTVRMTTNSAATLISTHNATPNASGRHPTAAIALRESPLPMRNNARLIPVFAATTNASVVALGNGTQVRDAAARTNSAINQGIGGAFAGVARRSQA